MMTQAAKDLTLEAYLAHDYLENGLTQAGSEGRCVFVNGALVEVPPESEPNDFIARYLLFAIASSGVVPLRLIAIHTCELQVPLLKPKTPQTRYPDLVILREDHIALTQKRLTITLDMPAPILVAEVVSPGDRNRERDYQDKLEQYQQRNIPEYWLIDPDQRWVRVLQLSNGCYTEVGTFGEGDRIISPILPQLTLTAAQIFNAGL